MIKSPKIKKVIITLASGGLITLAAGGIAAHAATPNNAGSSDQSLNMDNFQTSTGNSSSQLDMDNFFPSSNSGS